MRAVEYVRSNGNSYVISSVSFSPTVRYEVKFRLVDSSALFNNNAIFGRGQSNHECTILVHSNKIYFQIDSTNANINPDYDWHVAKYENPGYYVDGSQRFSKAAPSFAGGIGVGAYYYGGTTTLYKSNHVDFEYFKIWDGDTLMVDAIAAADDNGNGCFWDRVSNQYLRSSADPFEIGPYLTPAYTVEFDAAGGSGSMANQTIEIDTPTPLTPCSFTRDEYSFAGWSRTAGGPVEFQDGEIVENLAGDGETVELFAVWTALPPRFLLQFNPTDNEHLDKDLQTIHDLRGYFRDGCSVEDPAVLLAIDPADLAGVNYFTIPALRRGYFLTGQTVVRTGLVEISGHVDVLSSFATEIRQQRAIVRRAQSSDAFNLYLNDGSLKSYQNPYILTELFPNGFTGQSFILSVAGSSTPPSGT